MEPILTPLVDVDQLARELQGPNRPVLLDVRWSLTGPPGIEAFRAGHLPGAVFVDLDRELAAEPGVGGRHPLPAAEPFQAAMRAAGVSADRPVVVYDAADSTAAARAWWLLEYFGHRQVRVLDGGYRAWSAADRPVTTEALAPPPGDFEARAGALPVLDADQAAGLAVDGVLLDARSAERYRGETEPVDPVAGHIPGAVSAPTPCNVAADGRFLAVDELRRRFDGLGATEDRATGVYCGSGVTAAHTVLALRLTGRSAALYPGSWSEWITDPDRPVATGD